MILLSDTIHKCSLKLTVENMISLFIIILNETYEIPTEWLFFWLDMHITKWQLFTRMRQELYQLFNTSFSLVICFIYKKYYV